MTEDEFIAAIIAAEQAGLNPGKILQDYYAQVAPGRVGEGILP